ncbi:MAG: signal peptidase I [Patescibacteria group bacterium]
MRKFTSVIEVLKVIGIVFIAAVAIRYFLFQPFVVEGSSMEPNYHNGEYLFIEKVSYRLHIPERGDVVVFKYPNSPNINYIKRVVGLPGETLRIDGGRVSIDGKLLEESYLEPGEMTLINRNNEATYEITLPEGKYFVMGDNRDHSSDSRDGWLVPQNYIVGRSAVTIYANK